jgi:indole-3-glycerol phosphate synthase
MTILDKIIEYKRKQVAANAAMVPVRELEENELFHREVNSLSQYLRDKERSGIIAEFKRRSPSKGIINSSASVIEVTSGYFREGASGVSVLTDSEYFGGSSADLTIARHNNMFPILRKDFIIDEYQVIESKAIGADAVLLIAAVLEKQEIADLAGLAQSLGMEVLLEIHEQSELDMINKNINIIGVNNRDLNTFIVNTVVSEEIAEKIPRDFLRISESGINSVHVVKKLRSAGYDGFLIGEMFMSTPDPIRSFSSFVKELN